MCLCVCVCVCMCACVVPSEQVQGRHCLPLENSLPIDWSAYTATCEACNRRRRLHERRQIIVHIHFTPSVLHYQSVSQSSNGVLGIPMLGRRPHWASTAGVKSLRIEQREN